MDLRRLEVFAKVAELGSFSRAADALSLTQPTVSEHVRALEDELGVPLLDRLGRGAAPTHAGRLLLGYARRLLALQREAQQALDQFQGRMSGELAVGVPCRRRDGLDSGDQAGRARRRRNRARLEAGGGGRVPCGAPLLSRGEGSARRARVLSGHPPRPEPLAARRGLRPVRRIGVPGGHVLRRQWPSTPTRRSGSPRTPPAPAERPRWLLEISRRCSRRSSPWVARSPTCSSAWVRPTTPRSIASPPTWRSSRRWTSSRRWWTTRGPGARSRPRTRCPMSSPWAARCSSPSRLRGFRARCPRRSSRRSSAEGAIRSRRRVA